MFMRAELWGVVGLWRLRGVCRAFRRWATERLSSLPRVVAVGGQVTDRSVTPPVHLATRSVVSLDLSTLRWSAAGCMPRLPDPRGCHSTSCGVDGRVVVCCGWNIGHTPKRHLRSTALQWLPGTSEWTALPDLPARRMNVASVRLHDGRTMVIGGKTEHTATLQQPNQPLTSVIVLAADGSGWSDLPPLSVARHALAAALLPDGKVLVAGGTTGVPPYDTCWTVTDSAELWDPATQAWTALPPMAHARYGPVACVLPSGRVAVLGGRGADEVNRKDGEVFDPVKREWEPLPAEMACERRAMRVTAVSGGMLVMGGTEAVGCELYDEASGRWLALPRTMTGERHSVGLFYVPAAALVAASEDLQ